MTIYFDYSTMAKWSGNPTGIPRTVYCLARSIGVIESSLQLAVIDDQLAVFHRAKLINGKIIVEGPIEFLPDDILLSVGANWAFGCYNEQIRRLKNAGVYFYQLFYDIIPQLFPYFYEQGNAFGDYFGSWTVETLSLCDGAFAISECTKRDISFLAGIDRSNQKMINVVRLGEDFLNSDLVCETVTNRFIGYENYLLSVGTLEIRKNQACLLNAYRLLGRKYSSGLPRLIIVGRGGWLDGDIKFQVENDRLLSGLVDVITDATDEELDTLYNRCLFTLFPALYEGWGLPVAESLKHGKPCISSNTSSMLEISPALTRFASPYSVDEWVVQIEDLLFSKNKLQAEQLQIIEQYRSSSWQDAAEKILSAIKNNR